MLNKVAATSKKSVQRSKEHWPTFEEILKQLHQGGVYIHPHQLAEFMLMHGLPVDLCYVPSHLQQKAIAINMNYGGDMARLTEAPKELSCH